MRNQVGESGEEQGSRKEERQHRGSNCEAEPGRKRKGRNRGQVVRTGTEADERKRKERGKPESESKREALEEQLWERIKDGRKETNREPSTKNLEGKHERSGWRERGKPKKRERRGSTER